MGQKELASRLSLNSMEGPLKPEDLPITSDKITIIDVFILLIRLSIDG
jgi:hypothetical protein